MINTIKIILSVLFLFSFSSCLVGYGSLDNFTYLDKQKDSEFENKLKNNQIKKPSAQAIDSVLIFIEGEKLDFNYEKIGLIEVTGDKNSFESDLLLQLKRGAKFRGCNAIINFRKDFISRERGEILTDKPLEIYTSRILRGVAVKIIDTKI